MANNGFLYRAFRLYYDGFRSMTLVKIFFFPNFLSTHAEKGAEADFVATQLLNNNQ